MFHTGGDCVACQPLLFPTKTISTKFGVTLEARTHTIYRQETNALVDYNTWTKAAILDRLARNSNNSEFC